MPRFTFCAATSKRPIPSRGTRTAKPSHLFAFFFTISGHHCGEHEPYNCNQRWYTSPQSFPSLCNSLLAVLRQFFLCSSLFGFLSSLRTPVNKGSHRWWFVVWRLHDSHFGCRTHLSSSIVKLRPCVFQENGKWKIYIHAPARLSGAKVSDFQSGQPEVDP